MNFQELLTVQPLRTTKDISYSVLELLDLREDWFEDLDGSKISVELRVIKAHQYDSRRGWYLDIMYHYNQPTCIIQRAGRSNRDFSQRLVIDRDRYIAMCEAIDSQFEPDRSNIVQIDPTSNVTCFYDQDLEEPFEKIFF